MSTFPPVDEQMARIRERAIEVFPEAEVRAKVEKSLRTGVPLRAKLGVDPTAPDITLGNAVALWNLRAFQDLGHVAVLIIGDYTAQVGDPSGRNALRPMLTKEQVEAYAQTYLDQVGRILLPERLEIRRNSEWLAGLDFMSVLRLCGRVTVSQMLERDDFHKRFESEVAIGLHELLYPIMQGWDSVVVRADIELGGADQRFNFLLARDLQRSEGQEPQGLVINPLVAGTDGAKKMSKSAGNYIGITEPAKEQFGKAMSVTDALLRDWLRYFTPLPAAEIDVLCDPARTHPRAAKEAMAKAIVARYWGQAAADEAAEEFRRVFSQHEVPEDIQEIALAVPTKATEFLATHGLAKSKTDARRLIDQGAVTLDGARVADVDAVFDPQDGAVLKVGKRRFARLRRV